jgi:protein TonB
MNEFINENLRWPDTEADVIGRVVVAFTVEKDGSLSDIKVAKSLDPLFDKEAVRVVKSMPKWKPGMDNGEPIRVRFSVPVTFRLK